MNTASPRWTSISDVLTDPVVQSVLGILILLAVCAAAFYLLSKLRDSNSDDGQLDAMLRKNFEEMRSGGDINEQEFRNIKALLSGTSPSRGPDITSEPSSNATNDSAKDSG